MFRRMGLLFLALATGCASRNFPSIPPGPGATNGSGGQSDGATYLYVSSASSSANQITGYSVDTSGSLAPMAGSPFPTQGGTALSLAGTGTTVFGADGYSIFSFSVDTHGALAPASSLAAGKKQDGEPVGGPMQLFFDSSDADLYSFYVNLDGPDSCGYGAYSYSSSGKLAQTDTAGGSTENAAMLAFTGNDQYAYTSSASHGEPAITEYARAGNGGLTQVNQDVSFLSPTPPSGAGYLPYGAAADAANHIVIAMGETTEDSFSPNGPWQLAVYTVNSTGKLSTGSTYKNMTTLDVGTTVNWYAFSPDDKYLAVAGGAGVEVFAWNATNATFTAVGSTQNSGDNFNALAWDANDHLYALSTLSNSLSAYAVSAAGVASVSGSPYAIQNPNSLAVLSEK
jgi:6-phosphogluconolactonase (cycloisomerase 2 family)